MFAIAYDVTDPGQVTGVHLLLGLVIPVHLWTLCGKRQKKA
jgi:hypothetical protein